MEEGKEHVPGGRKLCQDQLDRVGWTLPRLPQDGSTEPFGERFAVPFGRRFDLLQLLGGEPGCYRFGAEDRARFGVWKRLRVEILAGASAAHGGARLWANPSPIATARQTRRIALSREHLLNQHVYTTHMKAASA